MVLIKGSWLLERARAVPFEPLPCRQHLPREAQVELGPLRAISNAIRAFRVKDIWGQWVNNLINADSMDLKQEHDILTNIREMQREFDGLQPIVAISHCWIDRNHPDPRGDLLLEIAPVLKAYLAKCRMFLAKWRSMLSRGHVPCKIDDVPCDKFDDIPEEFDGAFFFAWCSPQTKSKKNTLNKTH